MCLLGGKVDRLNSLVAQKPLANTSLSVKKIILLNLLLRISNCLNYWLKEIKLILTDSEAPVPSVFRHCRHCLMLYSWNLKKDLNSHERIEKYNLFLAVKKYSLEVYFNTLDSKNITSN